MTYKAIVAAIKNIEVHPNAQKLVIATVANSKVLIGLDHSIGEMGVYFECGGQLSEEFAQTNKLLRVKDPVTGKQIGGFFEENRRVKALKLRGVRSDGFWIPLKSLEFTGYDISKLKEGDQFGELNGVPICNKYLTKATNHHVNKTKLKTNRREIPAMPMHDETEQLKYFVETIPVGARVIITDKLHGTSCRFGYVWDDTPLNKPFIFRLLSRIPLLNRLYKDRAAGWITLNGSRRVILEKRSPDQTGYYGGEEFRYKATENLSLKRSEVLYGELVGYHAPGGLIMPPHNSKLLQDAEFTQQYGEQVIYKYGAPDGECHLYIYRIALTSPDGIVMDYPWELLKSRCLELGLAPVPEMEVIPYFDGNHEALMNKAIELSEGPDIIDPSHPREGVCIRVELPNNRVITYKHKSWSFKVMEGIAQLDDTYIDPEDIS